MMWNESMINRLIENDCVAFQKLDISAHTHVQFVSISRLLTLFGDLISLGFFSSAIVIQLKLQHLSESMEQGLWPPQIAPRDTTAPWAPPAVPHILVP